MSTGQEGEPGIDGAIRRREGSGGTCNTIDVPSVDEYVAGIEAAGAKTVAPNTAVPATAAPRNFVLCQPVKYQGW